MSDHLPPNNRLLRKDAFYSLCLAPLEYITGSIRRGEPWELEDLRPFVNRCRALVDAYDARAHEIVEDDK